MSISDLSYLEDVIEARSIVGGSDDDDHEEYFLFEHCKKKKYYDKHEDEYITYYKCSNPFEFEDDDDYDH